jgi:hypothetical protein
MTDLKQAYDAIIAKNPDLTEAWNYYLGDQPLVYANERLREIFHGVQVKFIENWCSVVVDSLKERLQLIGFQGPEDAQDQLDTIWNDNALSIESDDLHEGALVTGEAFLIIWPDENGQPEIYYNDPRLCHIQYYDDRPREPRYAAKMWNENDQARMTLYYPDHLEYYEASSKAADIGSVSAFEPAEEPSAPNPYGVVPVFHFKARRQGIGEIYDVIPIQNGINKLLTDMMVAAEYGAFRQRWVISNSDVETLKNAPNEIWSIPSGDGMGQATSVGEFSPTDLDNYLKAIEHLAMDISTITRMPKHYFSSQGGDPSGEALIAMEAPLNKKAANRIERFSLTWKQAIQFALLILGKSVATTDIEPVWAPVETVQPKTQAEIRVLETQAGIPLQTSLRREGWSDAELEEMAADKQGTAAELGEKLLSAFDRGDDAVQE